MPSMEVFAAKAKTRKTTAFGPPPTQRVGDNKTTGLENDDKGSETNDGSASSSYREDVSETEKDSANLGNDTPLFDGEQSHISVVGLPVESPIEEQVNKSIMMLRCIYLNLLTLTKIAKWSA